MKSLSLFAFLLVAALLSGCSTPHHVVLDGESAIATLPQEPKTKDATLPIKLFRGDPTSTAPPPIRVVRSGEEPPPPMWEETKFSATLVDYQVAEDPRYHWGAAVVLFDEEAVSELQEERFDFLRTHFIPPGHYKLLEDESSTENGLETVYAKGKHARGESQIELKMIARGNKVFCIRYEANLSNYDNEKAAGVLKSLMVKSTG